MAVYIELTEYQKLHIGSYDMKKQTNKQTTLTLVSFLIYWNIFLSVPVFCKNGSQQHSIKVHSIVYYFYQLTLLQAFAPLFVVPHMLHNSLL